MKLNRILIEGVSNIDRVELNLNGFDALIAFNNYGKSNVLKAISFGVDFIENTPKIKERQMRFKPFIPINNYIADKNFRFELEGELISGNQIIEFVYGYSFEWAKTSNERGMKITEEFLKMKSKGDYKLTSYINRQNDSSLFLASETGRCSKVIKVDQNQLIINKLENYDDLFYIDIIKQINRISIYSVNTLKNPNSLFRTISSEKCPDKYCLDMPGENNVGFFIYSMKMLEPNLFELYQNSVIDLLPNVESFDCFEVDMKDIFDKDDKDKDVPFKFPEKIYDIRVKERNLNQKTSISYISSGSQKIFYILAAVISAQINKVQLITFEELENSIHPSLLQALLITINELAGDSKVLISSHSPYLLQYLELSNIKVGLPNDKDLASFKNIKPSKYKKIMKLASDEETTLGDYIFGLMLEKDEDLFNEYFV